MPTLENVGYGSPDGATFGKDASQLVGFYGVAASRRPFISSRMDTTAVASSTDFAAGQLAVLQEIMNTLRGVGLWPTA
jgi:hypothetical protein